jgi:hypothetical protein
MESEMVKPLLRLVKLNGLQYNANRDPAAYRRVVGQPFHLEAWLDGKGEARCDVVDERGVSLASQSMPRPGKFSCELSFERAGSRVVTLLVESGGEKFAQALRLDVMAHAWIG